MNHRQHIYQQIPLKYDNTKNVSYVFFVFIYIFIVIITLAGRR